MQSMTARERVGNLLQHKPVDRASFYESLWSETVKRWTDEGHLKKNEDLAIHFKMELRNAGWFNCMANLDVPETIVEEDEATKLVRNGNDRDRIDG